MAESHSETSSEVRDIEALIEERDEIMHMLKWNAAVLSILLEQAGGVAEVTRQELESINLSKINATVEYEPVRDMYIIKGVYEDEV